MTGIASPSGRAIVVVSSIGSSPGLPRRSRCVGCVATTLSRRRVTRGTLGAASGPAGHFRREAVWASRSSWRPQERYAAAGRQSRPKPQHVAFSATDQPQHVVNGRIHGRGGFVHVQALVFHDRGGRCPPFGGGCPRAVHSDCTEQVFGCGRLWRGCCGSPARSMPNISRGSPKARRPWPQQGRLGGQISDRMLYGRQVRPWARPRSWPFIDGLIIGMLSAPPDTRAMDDQRIGDGIALGPPAARLGSGRARAEGRAVPGVSQHDRARSHGHGVAPDASAGRGGPGHPDRRRTRRWRAGDLDRLLNARHSELHELVARWFADQLPEWVLTPEVSLLRSTASAA